MLLPRLDRHLTDDSDIVAYRIASHRVPLKPLSRPDRFTHSVCSYFRCGYYCHRKESACSGSVQARLGRELGTEDQTGSKHAVLTSTFVRVKSGF
jgi:hypothetical protein